MIEKLRKLYTALLKEYSGGLSSTSTNKFDAIKELFQTEFEVSIDDIYATGAGTRPGNLEVRLSQGVQATKHTILGLAFLVDDKNTEENRLKLTNSTYTTVTKFLGRGKSSYENILILIQSDNSLYATGLISSEESDLSNAIKMKLDVSDVRYVKSILPLEKPNTAFNKIYFGAPGTGKSHKVMELVKGKEARTERITFHPEYDYSAFVGGYKPTMKGDNIRYEFVPQAFTKIYCDAWNSLASGNEEDFYLVIEEINRGNCAEIFGDIFQLLDRNSNYDISPSKELKEFLLDTEKGLKNIEFGLQNGKLKLPYNLNILGTMNTSDQSLFPMDSAFKRRWDWEYIPINDSFSEENKSSKFKVKLSETEYFSWLSFILSVNSLIKQNDNLGMDKCLGNYFIKPTSDIIDVDVFINKAIFYLWNDVFKDEMEENNIFLNKTTYEDFFPIQSVGIVKLKEILEILKIEITTE
jgi:hypothetical protein